MERTRGSMFSMQTGLIIDAKLQAAMGNAIMLCSLMTINIVTSKLAKPHTIDQYLKESITMKHNLIYLIASCLLLQATSSPDSPPSLLPQATSSPDSPPSDNCFFLKFTIYIVSHLPPKSPPLNVHCFSKDDDLGYHNLAPNVEYRFAFCLKPLATMFACRFKWNGKDKAFHVFDANWDDNRCKWPGTNGICYYAVANEGFYFTNAYPPPKQLGFLCDWSPNSTC
ncbi:hypothetical protein SASPL_136860 [Salvia splendens]|uniref:S-protein homolog n=1 Tax=Salvia splendens TaxID=180675 RepID=A0A8X8ZHY5_SALSN|nr:hypothetical protein SASPL_136860 [Salvia splendens]